MNKRILKAFSLIAIALFFIGAVLAFIILLIAGASAPNLGFQAARRMQDFTCPLENCRQISIDMQGHNVEFVTGSFDAVAIEYYENECDKISANCKNNTVTVKNKLFLNTLFEGMFSGTDRNIPPTVTVFLPEHFNGSISVSSLNCNATFQNAQQAQQWMQTAAA